MSAHYPSTPARQGIIGLARLLYESLIYYTALVFWWGVLGLSYTVLGAILFPLLPRRVGARFGRRLMTLLFRSFVEFLQASGVAKFDLSALDALRSEPGLIIAPNHPSLLDAVLVISHLSDIACIMKAEIRDNIFLGGGARLAGYIRNDSVSNMVRASVDELKLGSKLLVFPEGTRTVTKPVNPFKSGFSLIAQKAGAPVQTLFIESNTPYLGKHWPFFKKPEFPLIYRVRLGKRYSVPQDSKAFVAELEQYFRDELGPPRP